MPRRLQLAGALGHPAADKRLEILRRVGEGGSISEAARGAGVSYKAAWQALDMLSNLAGVPLVERAVGGAGGGGARLTAAGRQLLAASAEMARARQHVVARLSGTAPPGLGALALRTSMRNQLPCTVEALQAQGPLVRVVLLLGVPIGGDGAAATRCRIAARITGESAELLALAPGLPVVALCKATAVHIERPASAPTAAGKARRAQRAPGGTSLLPGRASRLARGGAGDEVVVQLDAGPALVGFAAPANGLRAGSRVVARLDDAAVVIALPG